MKDYRLLPDSPQDAFYRSRMPVQVFGGGFANGKTAAMSVKVLRIAREYPGANILVARVSYPKLADTIQKELLSWTPASWIQRKPTARDNTLYLTNGSMINFRYVQQTGQMKDEGTTSNLLSATYDAIAFDQADDAEFTHKDFLDLLGRLRGSTPYRGADPTMPSSGPRWFMLSLNPTSGWPYRQLVKPLIEYRRRGSKGMVPGLLYDSEANMPIIDLIEGDTYSNAHNLAADYIRNLEIAYQGQYRDRYLLGKWASYEGLVYSTFDPEMHVLPHDGMLHYLYELTARHVDTLWLRSYDHGIAAPACYLLAFCDHYGNIFIVDGFYEKEKSIEWLAERIRETDGEYAVGNVPIHADPQCFRRTSTIGPTVSGEFADHGVDMWRGANNISGGITKVLGYLGISMHRKHPTRKTYGSPRLFVSDRCEFFIDEIMRYRWKRNTLGEMIDEPVDRDNHAMDALRYLLTDRPEVAYIPKPVPLHQRPYMYWQEPPDQIESRTSQKRAHRYG